MESQAEHAQVERWLNASGHPVEFAVASAFERAGFEVYQGLHHKADVSRPREVDVLAVADKLDTRRPTSRCYVVYAIECKASDKPWVAFRSRDQAERWFGLDGLALELLTPEHLLSALDLDEDPWVLGGDKPHSFRVVQAFAKPGDADVVYGAFQQATAAARGFLHLDRPLHPAVAVPVVVTSSSLYSAEVSREGLSLSRSAWERVLWRGGSTSTQLVDVVCLDAIEEYIVSAAAGAHEMLDLMRRAYVEARGEGAFDNLGYENEKPSRFPW
jgi:hypothetical protein